MKPEELIKTVGTLRARTKTLESAAVEARAFHRRALEDLAAAKEAAEESGLDVTRTEKAHDAIEKEALAIEAMLDEAFATLEKVKAGV